MKLIAAISIDGAIGNDNQLLWNLTEDLKNYKDLTLNNIVIIGRKTYDNLPHNALNDRIYIVVKHDDNLYINAPNGSEVYVEYSIESAIEKAKLLKGDSEKDIFIAGGETIYKQMMDYCDECFITWINNTYESANKKIDIQKIFKDFELTEDSGWKKSKNKIIYKFTKYIRG